jgi:thioredoxin-related protein
MHNKLAFSEPRVSRRTYCARLAQGLSGIVALTHFQVVGAPAQLPALISMPDELGKSQKVNEPLIVMVSLAGCPYCRMARESYLGPMQKQGFPIVQVDMRSDLLVKTWSGQTQTHDQLVKQWRVSIAPTLLFFGPRGQELVERMEGGYLPDFYGTYLEERIAAARRALRS